MKKKIIITIELEMDYPDLSGNEPTYIHKDSDLCSNVSKEFQSQISLSIDNLRKDIFDIFPKLKTIPDNQLHKPTGGCYISTVIDNKKVAELWASKK